MSVENRPLSWFLAQRRQDLEKEKSEQRVQALREAREKHAKESVEIRDRVIEGLKSRGQDLSWKKVLSSFQVLNSTFTKTRRHLSELEDGDSFARMLDELCQKTRALEDLVGKASVSSLEKGRNKNVKASESPVKTKPPRVI